MAHYEDLKNHALKKSKKKSKYKLFFIITLVVINDIKNFSPFTKIQVLLHDELKIFKK